MHLHWCTFTDAPLMMHSVAAARTVSLLLCIAMVLIHTDRELHVHECRGGCKRGGCCTVMSSTCVELASEQAAGYLTEVCQNLEQQRSVPCQASSEGADRYNDRSVLPLQLPAHPLPLLHQLCV